MALDLQELNRKRIYETNIGEYDQITAVSQAAINFQLKMMRRLYKELQTIDIVLNNDGGELKCVLGETSVELLLDTQRQSVIYYMPLKDGYFTWWLGNGPKAVSFTEKIKDWILAFRVDLSFKQAGETAIPKRIRDQLEKPNDYSVMQLVLDFTTADIASYNVDKSYLPGLLGNDDPQTADGVDRIVARRTAFEAFFAKHINYLRLSQSGHNVLGSLPQLKANLDAAKSYSEAPTLIPTKVAFQNAPFLRTRKEEAKSGNDDVGGNNMLIYLEMTGKDPVMPSKLLDFSANWVVPQEGDKVTDGTVCLSRRIFLDGWLLPRLSKLNRLTAVEITNAFFEMRGTSYIHGVDYKCGLSATADCNFQEMPLLAEHKARAWFWNYHSSKEDSNAVAKVSGKSSTTTMVVIPVGLDANNRCVIKLSGCTIIDLWVHVDLMPSSGKVTAKWNADLVFSSVKDGGFVVTQEPEKVVIDIKKEVSDAWFHSGEASTMANDMAKALGDLPISDIRRSCEFILGDTWGFYFSGGGDFYMKNTCFNANGDLLGELNYKGSAE